MKVTIEIIKQIGAGWLVRARDESERVFLMVLCDTEAEVSNACKVAFSQVK